MTLAPLNGKGTTIVLADGVYRETIRPPSPATMMQTGQLVFQSASKDNSKATIRCSNSITGTSFKPLTTLSADIQAPFAAAARSQIYVADLGALGWTLPDLLRFRDDAIYEQRASGLNFLVQSSTAVAAGASLDPSKRYHAARAPNFRNVTNWKRAEHWWVADGPTAGSTTSLVDATDDTGTLLAPADIEAGNLKTIGVDLSGGYLRALDGMNSHWMWYRRIKSHDQTTGTVTIDTDSASSSCDGSTGLCTGCQPKYACGDANIDTNGKGFSPMSKYYVDNHPYLLDAAGEYYVDKTNLRLFVIPLSGVNVDASFVVELSKRRTAIDLTNTLNVTFDSLSFEMCDDTIAYANNWINANTRFITMRNLNMQLSGRGLTVIKTIAQLDTAGGLENTEHVGLIESTVRHMDDVSILMNQGWWSCSIDALGDLCSHAQIRRFYFGHNQLYELGFRPFGDDGTGGAVVGNEMVFENNLVRNVAHNGFQFIPGPAKRGAVYPYASSDLVIGAVLIKDNIFEWACLLESDCGGLKHWAGDLGFRDHLLIGNVYRNIIGWSYSVQMQNFIPTSWPYYNPVTRKYWRLMLGFAFGSYFDYAPGSYHFRNIVYNIASSCYQWTARIAESEMYFHNNLAANCYTGFASNWGAVTTQHKDTSIQGNIFAATALNGLNMFRDDNQQNGQPRSFEGNFVMDYNLWSQAGYDTRSDSVYRRGVADINYLDSSLSNGGNPTSTLAGLRAKEPLVSVHDQSANPAFTGFNPDVWANNILSRTQDATLTSFLTDNDIDWTAYTLSAGSPAVDKVSSTLPPMLQTVMQYWGLTPEIVGAQMDLGPLERGITWTASMKGPKR